MLLFIGLSSHPTAGQCDYVQVTHLVGTESVGCVDVLVTSDGSIGPVVWAPCFYGPYGIGLAATGSYTFTFSEPVTSVILDVSPLDNQSIGAEEMAIELNGGFYALTDPGVPDGCYGPVMITQSGTLMGLTGSNGSTLGVTIDEDISTLKITDTWLFGTPYGISVNVFVCCLICHTDAGEIDAPPISLCHTDIATVPPPAGTFLEADDVLEYILFSDLADTLGSIVQISNTPVFTFDPATMQTGVPYYIAALAGNDLNGNVDLDDYCKDFSNLVEVIWHPDPSVEFYLLETDVCQNRCYDVEINFIGTAPFHLIGELTYSDNTTTAIDQIYNGVYEFYTLCLSANTPAGGLVLQATSLTDEYCTCE